MQELIKIEEKEGKQFVKSLKEIYVNVGMDKSNWSRWIKKNIEESIFFSENKDYQPFVFMTNGNETKDYCCTLEMAKHLIMQMPTEKAFNYRDYLIKVEEAWNNPVQIMARALQIAKNEIDNYKNQIEEQKPKVEFANKILGSKDSILVRVYSKILFDEGINIGERKLYKWFRDNGYLSKTNEPYQKYMKYFEVKETPYDTPYGIKINTTTLVKPEGQIYFHDKIKESLVID